MTSLLKKVRYGLTKKVIWGNFLGIPTRIRYAGPAKFEIYGLNVDKN